jgi:hypothetical protein
MWRIWASVPLIILSLLSPSPGFAGESADWVVRKTTGLVEYSMMGAEGVPVETGDFLAPGMSLKTADNGRARLERGEEWLIVLPNTLVTNLAEPDPGMDTTLKVETGKIGVHVQKQSSQHFSVGAPNLVAVVKGTTFTVSADELQSQVSVIEGLVEVTSSSTQEVKDVVPGETVSVSAKDGSLAIKQGDPSDSASPIQNELEQLRVTPDEDPPAIQQAPNPKKGKPKGTSKSKGKSKRGNYSSTSGPGGYHGDDDHSHHKGKGKGGKGKG